MGRPEERSDDELLLAFKRDGDEEAFAALVIRHQAMIYRVAHRILGNAQDAKDATQRSLIVFARRAGDLRNTSSIAGWLHRVVTLESVALRRKRNTRTNYESEAMNAQLIQADGLPSEALPELDQSIQTLRPRDQQAVILHYLEGLSFPAIASRLGGTSDGWRKRCSRALEKLAVKLRSKGIGSATGLTIAATLHSQSAEAAMPLHVITAMTRDALLQKAAAGSLPATGSLAIIIMNTKLALVLGIIGGTMLSFAVERHRRAQEVTTAIHSLSNRSQDSTRTLRTARSFDLDALVTALIAYDEAAEPDPRTERRLRMLMFSIPAIGQIEEVADSINQVDHPPRFEDIVAALYARWAELDPAAAWAATSRSGQSTPAKEGVMLTWLAQDRSTAFEALMESREDGDLTILVKYLRHQSSTSPRDAALFVDQIAEVWPEADRRLFPLVAKNWVIDDPIATADWVVTHPDSDRRNALLSELAKRTVRESHGLMGLALANRIDDPAKRAAARLNTIRWFGVSTGTRALKDPSARPNRDLRAGFPDDWSNAEITVYSLGCMANYVDDYPLIVGLAQNEDERQSIYLGAIQGAGFSKPSVVADAVANLDVSAIEGNPSHQQHLKIFIRRWTELDSASAEAWLHRQPTNLKTKIMKDALPGSSEE